MVIKYKSLFTVMAIVTAISSWSFATEFGLKNIMKANSCDIFPEYGPVGGILGVSIIAKSDDNLSEGASISPAFRNPEDALHELLHLISLGLCRQTKIEKLAKECGIEPDYGMMGEFLGFNITRDTFAFVSRTTIDSALKELENLKHLGLCKK
ncbi:MAG: hypothetical protein ACXVCP_19040 [Bdellovibrio sp.]